MSPRPQHLLHFEGGNALSAFRAQALLPRLQAAAPRIAAVAARHVHWTWSDAAPTPEDAARLARLLDYGDPYAGPGADAAGTTLVVVMPRLGTVSPWASKATDIAHNCGLAVHRVERVTEADEARVRFLLRDLDLERRQRRPYRGPVGGEPPQHQREEALRGR